MTWLGQRVRLHPHTRCFLRLLTGCVGIVHTIECDDDGVLMYRVHLDAVLGEGFFWYESELERI